jgi:agmatinase
VTTGFPTFLRLPAATLDDLPDTPVVVLGAAEATPYDPTKRSHSADAPGAIRAASQQFAGQVSQHDFDLDATLLAKGGDPVTIGVDVGDVVTKVQDADGNRHRIAAAVEQVLDAGALPVVLGGDDSVPIPVLAAYDRFAPVTVVQIDAHVDWGGRSRMRTTAMARRCGASPRCHG